MKAQSNATKKPARFLDKLISGWSIGRFARLGVVLLAMSTVAGCVAEVGDSSEAASSGYAATSSNCSQTLPDGLTVRETTVSGDCKAEIPKSTIYRDEEAQDQLVRARSVSGWDGYQQDGFRPFWVTF